MTWCDLFIPAESVCPTRIPVASRDEKGFELMLGMKVFQKTKKIQGSLASEAAYLLSASVDITENTKWVASQWTHNYVQLTF